MGLIKVHIENFKSIGNCSFDFSDINLFLGENGTGKSNILSAILYFFNNLVSRNESDEIFDNNNLLNNRVVIALTFDMSRLRKYCNANLKNENMVYKAYFERIIGYIKCDEITIKMIKIKDYRIRWSHSIEVRKLIASLFPLYYVDSRNIDLINWEVLWKHIGDLTKIENSTSTKLKNDINSVIVNVDPKMKKRLDDVKGIFDQLNIKITPFQTSEFAATISQIFFTGSEYVFNENKLSNFSNGTNSYNYTYLLIYILKIIAQTKMKEPLIILDEPEISLHNRMVDNLTEAFCMCSENLLFVIATHSPRLIKNILIRDEGFYKIYQVYKQGDYTNISKFSMFHSKRSDLREKFFITDQHASAYFSKSLLLVEGESELEIFQNKFLRGLYDCLNQVEVIKSMSDDVVYRVVSANKRNCNIPMLSLIDMDKVYDYNDKLKDKYFLLFKDKEKYYFQKRGEKLKDSRLNLKVLKNRIYAMSNKCEFNFLYPFYSSDTDDYYKEFIKLIKEYFEHYGIFVAKTTIEGMLITKENKSKVIEFLKVFDINKYNSIFPIYNYLDDNSRLNFLRLIFKGKSDLILSFEQIVRKNENMDVDLKKTITQNRITKTAWITEWLQYYFCNITGLDYKNSKAYYGYQSILMNINEKKRIMKSFSDDFPEFYHMLQLVNDTLN